MGQGGQLGLINGTKYVWRKIAQSQYQMEAWNFPDQIPPGTVSANYVEFKQNWNTHRGDTQGNCTYILDGTNCKFQISIRDAPATIKVRFENIETPNNPNGSEIDIGFAHDGIKYFILSGRPGNFSSNNPPTDWMQQNLQTIGPKALAQVCIPGTHDAGMGEITWSDDIPTPVIAYFTQTQSLDILGQLHQGSRYFDIRPEISMGSTWTGHYEGKLGARGQRISSVIDNINTFTEQHKELIIVNLSHAKNTDDNFRDYNQDEWNSLMNELLRLNNRYIYTGDLRDDISLLRIEQFIGNNRAAVLCVIEAPAHITLDNHFTSQGFYLPTQLNVRNEYSNTDDNVRMVTDQIDKLTRHASGGDKRLFLLSWTLTQQKPELNNEILAQITRFKSIRELAYSANKSLFMELFPRVNTQAFPNIVYVDFMEHSDYVALAMAINHKWLD